MPVSIVARGEAAEYLRSVEKERAEVALVFKRAQLETTNGEDVEGDEDHEKDEEEIG